MTIMQTRNNRRLGFTLIELMLVIAIIAILASILTPSFLKARAQAQLTACKSNVKNIGTACEMFAIERKGRYPEQIAFLTLGAHGGYLKSIPSCPAAGYDTYSASYTFASNPDCFTVRCGGANHIALNIPEGYPLYDSVVGLACSGAPGEEVASAGGSGNGGSESSGSGSGGSESSGSDNGGSESGDSGRDKVTDLSSPEFNPDMIIDEDNCENQRVGRQVMVVSKYPRVSYNTRFGSYSMSANIMDYSAVQRFQQMQAAFDAAGVQTSVEDGIFGYDPSATLTSDIVNCLEQCSNYVECTSYITVYDDATSSSN